MSEPKISTLVRPHERALGPFIDETPYTVDPESFVSDLTYPWTPAQINTLVWYDADDSSTIVVDSLSRVSQWNDKSGNGYNVSQSTSARQPSYVTNGVGGKASLSFNESGLQFNFADTIASDYTA
eukprot:scaffold16362_cov165-Isochrysis_galbana.AAC.1